MCLTPFSIPNPNYGKTGFWYQLKDTKSQMLSIPCGHCSECISLKQIYLVERFQMECLCNHAFFATLTYKNDMLPEFLTETGYSIPYADYNDFVNLYRNMCNSGYFPGLRACAVSEFGGLKGRPHWHCVFLLPKGLLKDYNDCLSMQSFMHDYVFEHWARNIGSKKRPYYNRICEYHEKWITGKLYKNYDLHFINPSLTPNGADDVAWYVFKYMLKPSTRETRLQQALHLNLEEDYYNEVWNIVKPRLYKSQGFGLNGLLSGRKVIADKSIVSYLHDCIEHSDYSKNVPCYFVPSFTGRSGISFPLARFYREHADVFSAVDALNFFYNCPNPDYLPEIKTGQEKLNEINIYKKRLEQVSLHGSDDYLDF